MESVKIIVIEEYNAMKREAMYWGVGTIGFGILTFLVILLSFYCFDYVGENLTNRIRSMW